MQMSHIFSVTVEELNIITMKFHICSFVEGFIKAALCCFVHLSHKNTKCSDATIQKKHVENETLTGFQNIPFCKLNSTLKSDE